MAGVATRPVDVVAAAPETQPHQFAVDDRVDQAPRRSHLRARQTTRQIAARILGRQVELQPEDGQVFLIAHAGLVHLPGSAAWLA